MTSRIKMTGISAGLLMAMLTGLACEREAVLGRSSDPQSESLGLAESALPDNAARLYDSFSAQDPGYAMSLLFSVPMSQAVLLSGDFDGNGRAEVGVYNRSNGQFSLMMNGQIRTFGYGPVSSTIIPIVGDWDGDGRTTIGVYDQASSLFFLRNSNSSGFADITFGYGSPNAQMLPIAGDWTGNHLSASGRHISTIGLYQPSTGMFFLRNSNDSGMADIAFPYGPIVPYGSLNPLAGDWNHDGKTTIGVFLPGVGFGLYLLRNSNDTGYADITVWHSASKTIQPLVGDFNGDGVTTVGYGALQ